MQRSPALPMPKGTTVSRGTEAIDRALAIVRRRADGGGIRPDNAGGASMPAAGSTDGTESPISGPVIGPTGGREDAIPVSVLAGSFVIPADVVAALGDGNTLAGMQALESAFGNAAGAGAPRRPYAHLMAGGASTGGAVSAGAGQGEAVPILISDGEYVVSPERVVAAGGGDLDQGHRALDAFVRQRRAEYGAKLKALPGPAKG